MLNVASENHVCNEYTYHTSGFIDIAVARASLSLVDGGTHSNTKKKWSGLVSYHQTTFTLAQCLLIGKGTYNL